MFIANFNVFIVLLVGASYIFAWILGIPIAMLTVPFDDSLLILERVLFFVTVILLFIWGRRGLVSPSREPKYFKIYQIGQWMVAIANCVLIGGIGLLLQAATISKEDEYWVGLLITSLIAPIGGLLAAIGLALVILIPLWHGTNADKPTRTRQ